VSGPLRLDDAFVRLNASFLREYDDARRAVVGLQRRLNRTTRDTNINHLNRYRDRLIVTRRMLRCGWLREELRVVHTAFKTLLVVLGLRSNAEFQ
jgi:hypothetical protein